MAILSPQAMRRKGAVKGRECRNQTLNTKLTASEAAAVEVAAVESGKAVGEWLRDLALRELSNSNHQLLPTALLGEVTALRLLLINALEPFLRGDKMTAEQFKAMLQYVKNNKRKAAADSLASYAEGGNETL